MNLRYDPVVFLKRPERDGVNYVPYRVHDVATTLTFSGDGIEDYDAVKSMRAQDITDLEVEIANECLELAARRLATVRGMKLAARRWVTVRGVKLDARRWVTVRGVKLAARMWVTLNRVKTTRT